MSNDDKQALVSLIKARQSHLFYKTKEGRYPTKPK